MSAENKTFIAFGALALVLSGLGSQFPWWDGRAFAVVVVVVAVVLPLVVTATLDDEES